MSLRGHHDPKAHKCPYDGCSYVAKSSLNSHAQNLSCHISNRHRASTQVWFGGIAVIVHRDTTSNTFLCPCGKWSNSNASSLRQHIKKSKNVHRRVIEAICISAARASKPAVSSKADEGEMYRPVYPNLKGTLHIVGGEVKLVPEGPDLVHKADPLVAFRTPMDPSGKDTPTSAGASSKTSSAFFKSIAESTSSSPARPFLAPASTVNLRSDTLKRKVGSEVHTSRPSKIRRTDAARPTSTIPQAMTKKMYQREFECWFARWSTAYRARRAPRLRFFATEEDEDEERGEEPKTDWWRVEMMRRQGGVCFQTPDAFFAALGDALARHRHSATKEKEKDGRRGKGTGGVLTFFGGYSIVAQPNISAMVRLAKVAARMEEIGFRLDETLRGYGKFQYKLKGAVETMDHVCKYPCTCGGTPPPRVEGEMRYAHRIPDERYAGEECGGTIIVMVGEDNALLAFGIPGQRIAVDIVH